MTLTSIPYNCQVLGTQIPARLCNLSSVNVFEFQTADDARHADANEAGSIRAPNVS